MTATCSKLAARYGFCVTVVPSFLQAQACSCGTFGAQPLGAACANEAICFAAATVLLSGWCTAALPATAQPVALTDDAIADIMMWTSRNQYYATRGPCACPEDKAHNGGKCGGNKRIFTTPAKHLLFAANALIVGTVRSSSSQPRCWPDR